LDQAVPSGDVAAKLSIVEDKIKTAKENIDANRKALKQMDEAVDQSMARSQDEKGADKAVAIRRGQQKERQRLQAEIASEQMVVAKLNEEAAPIRSEVRKVEAEVGPIKYIAAVIYEGTPTDDILEKAVRFVTMMIVAVFDPLAVLLLIAANWNLKRKDLKVEPVPTKEFPTPEDKVEWAGFYPLKTYDEVVADEDEDEPEPIQVNLSDELVVEEKHEVSRAALPVEPAVQEEIEIPEITVEEHNKDWEPALYDRQPIKKMGRYMEESGRKPSMAQSFLNKVQETFAPKTIEQEVNELQDKK
jgi:hypothetical protein